MKQIKNISLVKNWLAIIALAGLILTVACGTPGGGCCGFLDRSNYQDLNGGGIYSTDANGCIIGVGSCNGHNFQPLSGNQT